MLSFKTVWLLPLALVCLSGVQCNVVPQDESYGVLVDAGSTSSKLKIYRMHSAASTGRTTPEIELLKSQRFKPGLSEFEDNSQGLVDYMRSILDVARAVIPSGQHSTTRIFVMATAGLRLLTARDASELMGDVTTLLEQSSFSPFVLSPGAVTILSGEEEGVYSWIAANYLLDFFESSTQDEAVGILEMGGGSTQIAFIPNGPLFSEEFQVRVGGKQYDLYVQSYLQYGANGIKLRIAAELLKTVQQPRVDNPCMLRGDTDIIEMEDGTMVNQTGTSDPDHCLQLLRVILQPDSGLDCSPKPCAIGSVYQPSLANISFYATGAFNYAPNALEAVDGNHILHLDTLIKNATQYCSKSLAEVLQQPGSRPKYASSDCMMGLYIPTLLTLPYRLPITTTNVKVASKINNGKIDWALGAMLIKLSSTSPDNPNQQHYSVRSVRK